MHRNRSGIRTRILFRRCDPCFFVVFLRSNALLLTFVASGLYRDTHSHDHFFSVLAFRHILTRCAQFYHFCGSRSDCQNRSIKSSLLTCRTCVQRKPHPRLGHPVTNLLTFFLRGNSTLSGGMTTPQSNAGSDFQQ